MGVAPSKKLSAIIVTNNSKYKKGISFIEKLSGTIGVQVVSEKPVTTDKMIATVTGDSEILIPMTELVDKAKETERLNKEKQTVLSEIKRSSGMLNNERFISKAPANLVEAEKAKLAKYTEMLEKLDAKIKELENF